MSDRPAVVALNKAVMQGRLTRRLGSAGHCPHPATPVVTPAPRFSREQAFEEIHHARAAESSAEAGTDRQGRSPRSGPRGPADVDGPARLTHLTAGSPPAV